jgi:glycosyltransferase involved in cell wall biosynthesis
MITFIIPSIGRESLFYSLESLINQTDPEWQAIIVLDGITVNMLNVDALNLLEDERFEVHEIEKMGSNINQAAFVRNYGMSVVNGDSDWLAFLDDDDTIAKDYIEIFKNELLLYPECDVYIYRMIDNDQRIIPELNAINFKVCDVGISFIINLNIYKNGLEFELDGAEDFLYLNKIRKAGYKMIISPYIKYYVRNFEYSVAEIGKRGLINIVNPLLTFMGHLLISEYENKSNSKSKN